MKIHCQECESAIDVHPPRGRWLIAPALFNAQSPTAIPLGYNVMLTEEGTKHAECECGVHFVVAWEIVWSLTHDRQGTRVRYVMSHPIPYKPCPSCGHHWTKCGEGYSPTQIDGRSPCGQCTDQARTVSGWDGMFR